MYVQKKPALNFYVVNSNGDRWLLFIYKRSHSLYKFTNKATALILKSLSSKTEPPILKSKRSINMQKNNDNTITIAFSVKSLIIFCTAILILVGAFFLGIWNSKSKATSGSNLPGIQVTNVAPITEEDWIIGNRDAKIALIEYSDLECPFCQKFHTTAQQISDVYKDELVWVYRHFPLTQIHPNAQKYAEATECAAKQGGNDAFWAMSNAIFTNIKVGQENLGKLAQDLGYNKEALESCLSLGETQSLVQQDQQSGVQIGVTGTPGNVILNTKTGQAILLPGALPFEQIKQAIEAILK
ncbi:DsbA family protein [candidate division WWE3 bacterium]|uniref:DsbA family protein n=1 Tax=candidate division WWE3 bacterium TaxID=2053526 RepID=A0A955J1S7_UNCKA|nr:DsbA family protein [candidate division WWE3 bacterium]